MSSVPVTILTKKRDVFKPFDYPWAFEAFVKHEKMHWNPEEIPMDSDINDWNNKLTEPQKELATHILRFFTQGDIDVAKAYNEKFIPMCKLPELRMMMNSFAAREAVHIWAYSYLIESLGMPEVTYSQFHEYKEMRDKHEYVEAAINNKESLPPEDIAIFSAFTEGLQLFGSFVILLNYSRFGLLRGLGEIIGWSIKDESIHCDSMIKFFRTYVTENRKIWNSEFKKRIYDYAERAVELEDKFLDLAFANGGHVGELDCPTVKSYIRYLADRRLIELGLKPIFRVKHNPCPWIEPLINAPSHTNFFEQKVIDYSKGSFTGDWKDIWVK